jgi:OOP family OmpA-OmpF porin
VKVDKDGCPLDSDGDGVPDYLDKCPGTPAGVKVDKDGCPPPPAPVEKAIVEKGRATLKVHFDFDKAVVKNQYHDEIGNLAEVLRKYPDLKIMIEGHTDSTGDVNYNERLSLRRAEAVQKYLVEKFGIAASRLSAKGFGESLPVASNATREGRQQNRRVEAAAEYITIIKR